MILIGGGGRLLLSPNFRHLPLGHYVAFCELTLLYAESERKLGNIYVDVTCLLDTAYLLYTKENDERRRFSGFMVVHVCSLKLGWIGLALFRCKMKKRKERAGN